MDISVIIVNWNTKALLERCLTSVFETMPENCRFEVIVVDNASSDGSLEMLAEKFPRVSLIANTDNRGFGAANNQAFAVMKGEYALLLNADAMLTSGAVEKLWTFAVNCPQAAIVCGQLLNADGSKQHSVAAFPSLLTLATNISFLEYLFPQKYPSKRYEHKQPLEVDSAIGACMLLRKRALEEVGFFDERYFFFFEETDLAYALRHRGWKIYHLPDAFIYHLQGQSIGHDTRSRIEFYRSRYQFLRKWHGSLYFYTAATIIVLRLVVSFFLTAIAAVVTFGLLERISKKTSVYGHLIAWHLKSLSRDDVVSKKADAGCVE